MNSQLETNPTLPDEPIPQPEEPNPVLPDEPVPQPNEPHHQPAEPRRPIPPHDPGQPEPPVPNPVTIPPEKGPSPLI